MNSLARTTITLPEDLIQELKIYAAQHKTNVSELIRRWVTPHVTTTPKSTSLLEIAGSLSLKGKQPPTRSKLYGHHLKQKLGA